jgi:hypothetical protein
MTEEVPQLNKETKIFYVIGIILFIAILFFLLFGLRHRQAGTNKVDYSYFTFEEIGGLWQTTVQLDKQAYQATFRYNPTQVQDVTIMGNFSGFRKLPIYITFDPEADKDEYKYLALAASELTLNIVRALNFTVEAACTKNITDACADRPIITCKDDASVIYLIPKAPTQITLDGHCVILSGSGFELLKSIDRILFQWYKIMK